MSPTNAQISTNRSTSMTIYICILCVYMDLKMPNSLSWLSAIYISNVQSARFHPKYDHLAKTKIQILYISTCPIVHKFGISELFFHFTCPFSLIWLCLKMHWMLKEHTVLKHLLKLIQSSSVGNSGHLSSQFQSHCHKKVRGRELVGLDADISLRVPLALTISSTTCVLPVHNGQ